jgi:hypothetical protein
VQNYAAVLEKHRMIRSMSGPVNPRRLVSEKLEAPPNSKKGYLRARGWKDLIFLCVLLVLGAAVKHYLLPPPPSDYERWKARPKLDSRAARKVGHGGPDPCFFIIPPGAVDQPAISGTVGDCLMLVPDGRNLDLCEVAVRWGDFFPIKTNLYVADTIPLAFTRTYNSTDAWTSRIRSRFRHVYDPYLYGDRNPYTYLKWILPDGVHVPYGRISPGKSHADALYEEVMPFPVFEASRIGWNGWGWDLTLRTERLFCPRWRIALLVPNRDRSWEFSTRMEMKFVCYAGRTAISQR